jgi:UDP-N-acetylglucosamine diphosphorylase / glucose-1-phosphate thymidylyltransferase / UDP-N-acetylgalactosamine diphosphorylase / glucosamine-1-phosphate N-acetyltransferase / galactosamine-1-phosphate N-acetyltransferase
MSLPAELEEAAPDAIVLAAGRGNRLRPLTDSLPKVLVPIGGKPLLAFHLEALRKVGVRRVVIVVGYRSSQVRDFVGDGSPFGLDAQFVLQSEPKGTGDALRVARGAIHSDSIVVCYGDVFLTNETELLRRLLQDSRPKIAAAWVSNGGDLGRLLTADRGGRQVLEGLQEKDGRPTPALVNAGLYLLPRRIFDIADRLPLSPRGEWELTDAVLYFAHHEGEIEVVEVSPWVDIANHDNLARAESLARSGSPATDT